MIARWQSSIAHADMADWVTIAAYLVTALLSVHAAGRANTEARHADRLFWRTMAMLMTSLGINELLDLEMLLTPVGRGYAEAHGWYGEHRRFQRIAVVALSVASVLAEFIMLWWTRHAHAAVRWALAGLIFIVLFIVLRAVSFHQLDDILTRGAPAFNWGSVQEMTGILVVAASAILYAQNPRDSQ